LQDEKDYSENLGDLTSNFWLNAVQGVIVYTLFYQVCILCPIDMAKVWMLRSNIKVIGLFFCILCGFTTTIQSLFFEYFISKFVTTNKDMDKSKANVWILDALEMFCCIIAIASILPIIREEDKEVKIMQRL
jgi:hypothetical protein